jgi:hypothetical protein
LLNIVPGAFLALFGAALLTTEARGMVLAHRPAILRQGPAAEGTSWHRTTPKSFDPKTWRLDAGARS